MRLATTTMTMMSRMTAMTMMTLILITVSIQHNQPSPLTIEGTPDSSDGFQALNATLSNVLEDLSISYALRINARRGFAKLLKTETSLSGSSGRTIKASAS